MNDNKNDLNKGREQNTAKEGNMTPNQPKNENAKTSEHRPVKGAQTTMEQEKMNWDNIKGLAKKNYVGLTDADFNTADGSVEKLYGIIHSRFGDNKEVIKRKLGNINSEPNKR